MPSRPAIPAEITREILLESGHRCAVCGTPCPLERAHIIPWRKSREHQAKDLICLCANCHARADKEKWGEKTLREYKRRPWVLRQYKTMDSMPEPKTKLQITIGMEEVGRFGEKDQRWLQYALAAFLKISPHAVQIVAIEQGSVKVIIELPALSADRLLNAFEDEDQELAKYLAPLVLLDLRRETAGREAAQVGYLDDGECRSAIERLAREAARRWAPDEVGMVDVAADEYFHQVREAGQILHPLETGGRPLGLDSTELLILIILPVATEFMGNLLAEFAVDTLRELRSWIRQRLRPQETEAEPAPPPLGPDRIRPLIEAQAQASGLSNAQIEQLAQIFSNVVSELLSANDQQVVRSVGEDS